MEGGHLSSHWLLALGASYKLLKAKHQPGFPGGLSGEESTCQRRRGETRVPSLSREDPLEEGVAAPPPPPPPLLPGESHGQRGLAGCRTWGRRKGDATERTH